MICEKIIRPLFIISNLQQRTPESISNQRRLKNSSNNGLARLSKNFYKKQRNASEPAIKKAGLNPLRADADIFGTGKIIDQIWTGINSAKVLIAELTSRNPNVFYELGLAHALRKPVVLICSNEDDVPFDLKHIRVIYYDMHDPFWGTKLIEKIAENILSAISNPDEAILFK